MKKIISLLSALTLFTLFSYLALSPNPKWVGVDDYTKAKVAKLETFLDEDEHDSALILLTELLNTNQLPTKLRIYLLKKRAAIHKLRLHLHYAIRDHEKIRQLSSSRNSSELSRLRKSLERLQVERHLKSAYAAGGKNAGISKTMKKKIVVAYIYLNNNLSSQWSSKDRLQNHSNMNRVVDWFKKQSVRYDVEKLDIDVRYFFITPPRGYKKQWLERNDFIIKIKDQIAKQLGYRTFEGFVESLEGNDSQVAMVFHSNHKGRSFARVCHGAYSRCKYEYAILTEEVNDKRYNWRLPQVQAHEVTHLFGAADLYNIKQAKDFAVTDIMNYTSSSLRYSEISPITAWAVGWSERPKTPFIIKQ
ncbi:hypothetical protein SOPP22_15080 [Shewanella sp. OPT22]|nr:hypothetical protein SOPP22_15080 [Shewanella sp. OPT22]